MIGVYHAVSANEGIKLLTQHSFCLVIMDIIQPEINGIDLLKLIRQIRSIPVLVLSSKPKAAERIAVFKAGAHGHLEKTCDMEECLAQARSLIELYMQLHTIESSCYTLAFGVNLIIDSVKRQAILKGKPMNLT